MTTATTNPAGPDDNPLLGWALYLAAMGWHVFPLAPMTKRQPAVKDWENRATTDPDRIRRCWAADRWNIGIATGPSGLVVVDLDMPKDGDTGPDGPTAVTALAATGSSLRRVSRRWPAVRRVGGPGCGIVQVHLGNSMGRARFRGGASFRRARLCIRR